MRTGSPRWLLPALCAGLVALAACGEDQGPGPPLSPAPAPTETTPPAPASLPGASCDRQEGGSEENVPDFVSVTTAHEDGIDRITFGFELRDPGVTEPPSYSIQFTDQLTTDAEGAPVEVEGDAFVSVNFSGVGTDLTTETPSPVYTGPEVFEPGLPTLREARQLGDFEAVITWGLGLARKACFRVDAEATSLTIEFPSP
jgi:hypothetical protein